MKNNIKKINGYILIEAMIGIGIALMGILGILNILSRSVSLNRTVSNQFVANYLAAEGVEIVKNLIDGNIMRGDPWNQGLDAGGSFEVEYSSLNLETNNNDKLLFNSTDKRYNYEIGDATGFTRTIEINPIGSDEIRVNSIVQWTSQGGGQNEINLEDHFFNWRQ